MKKYIKAPYIELGFNENQELEVGFGTNGILIKERNKIESFIEMMLFLIIPRTFEEINKKNDSLKLEGFDIY